MLFIIFILSDILLFLLPLSYNHLCLYICTRILCCKKSLSPVKCIKYYKKIRHHWHFVMKTSLRICIVHYLGLFDVLCFHVIFILNFYYTLGVICLPFWRTGTHVHGWRSPVTPNLPVQSFHFAFVLCFGHWLVFFFFFFVFSCKSQYTTYFTNRSNVSCLQ